MKKYLKLLRVKHYIKNLLIFVPLFFSKQIMDMEKIKIGLVGFVCFSLVSSTVYIINDLQDVEKDRIHPTKKMRPIASGAVSKKKACLLVVILIAATGLLSLIVHNVLSLIILLIYLGLNIVYSLGLKNYPIIDIVILASGFVLRIIYGGMITDIEISSWLYLVVVSGSLYMGLGKRRNELRQGKETRDVLKSYNEAFLDKNMYVFMALVNVFYASWTISISNRAIAWSIPMFMVILMRYSYDIEGNSDGDPVEVVLRDKILLIMGLLYAMILAALLYLI